MKHTSALWFHFLIVAALVAGSLPVLQAADLLVEGDLIIRNDDGAVISLNKSATGTMDATIIYTEVPDGAATKGVIVNHVNKLLTEWQWQARNSTDTDNRLQMKLDKDNVLTLYDPADLSNVITLRPGVGGNSGISWNGQRLATLAEVVPLLTGGLTVATNGFVGIGTTIPGSKLTLGSGQLELPAGSASAPSLTFSNDPNMGIFRSAADTLVLVTAGVSRWQVSSAGNLNAVNGTEIVAAGRFLTAGGSGSAAAPTFSFGWGLDENTGMFRGGTDILGFSTGGTERMRVDASGNVGIGTTTPTAKLHVTGSGRFDSRVRIAPQGDIGMGEFISEPAAP